MRLLLIALLTSGTGCRAILGAEEPLPLEEDGATDAPLDTPSPDVSDTGADILADSVADASAADPIVTAEALCARWTACNQGVGAPELSNCVHRYLVTAADRSTHPLAWSSWSCLAAARTCDAIASCLGGATAPSACAGVSSGTVRVCVGGSVVTCAGKTNAGAEPCALDGRQCVVSSPTDAACVASSDCPAAGSPKCTGTRLLACAGALDKGADCAKLGGVCVTPDAGPPGCTGDESGACAAGACDGTVARYCRFGRPAAIDCALLGSRCDPTTQCLPEGTICKDGDPASCVGGDVRFCLGGNYRLIKCSVLGLGGCREAFSLSGVSAACAP